MSFSLPWTLTKCTLMNWCPSLVDKRLSLTSNKTGLLPRQSVIHNQRLCDFYSGNRGQYFTWYRWPGGIDQPDSHQTQNTVRSPSLLDCLETRWLMWCISYISMEDNQQHDFFKPLARFENIPPSTSVSVGCTFIVSVYWSQYRK